MHFDDVVLRFAASARRRGVRRPMAILVGKGSAVGRAVAQEVRPRPRHQVLSDRGDPYEAAGAIPVAGAVPLLRRHAGLGGAAVANLLEAPPGPADCWAVVFEQKSLAVAGYRNKQFVYQSGAGYGGAEFLESIHVPCDLEERWHDYHLAVALVGLSMTRKLPGTEDETTVPLPVDDELLARVLRRYYRNKPAVVQAVLHHLEEVSPGDHSSLTRLIRDREELDGLARGVGVRTHPEY